MGRKKHHHDFDDIPEVEPEASTELVRIHENTLLYLPDGVEAEQVVAVLAPPDLIRCQCEWVDTQHPTFGPKPLVRCDHEPTVIAFQRRAYGDVTPTGSMSLCDEHRTVIEHMFLGQCYFRRITTDKKIGDFA